MKDLIEKLAELEHEQWSHWIQHMLGNFHLENVSRWKKQAVTPYDDLSEEEKASDREWAERAWEIILEHFRDGGIEWPTKL